MSQVESEHQLPDEPLIKHPIRKQGCCKSIYRCICCCCVRTNVIFIQRKSQKTIWAKIVEKISGKRDFDPVYKTLFDLFSEYEPAIAELKSCNISPNFKSHSRDDLEFYVPQIWYINIQ